MSIALHRPLRQSLVANIEEQLGSALISGQLRPGQRLVTRDLARQLGTSPTPVREALIRLVAAGALTAEPGQAFQVPMLLKGEYLEICAIRHAVEGLAAEQAARRITAPDIEELELIARRFRDAKRAGDVAQALHFNRKFRFTLYTCAQMPYLLAIIEGLWLRIGPCFNYLYPQRSVTPDDHHNYDDVIVALRKADGAAARKAIDRAIDQGADILAPYLGDDESRNDYVQSLMALALP